MSRLQLLLTSTQRSVGQRVPQSRNHRMICHTRRAIRLIIFLRIQLSKPGRIRQRAAKSLLRRPAQSCLSLGLPTLPAMNKNPFSDARLHIHFNQFIQNFDHLFAQVRSIIQTRQLERLERGLRAARNVLQHHFRRLHDASPSAKVAGSLPRDINHTVSTDNVNTESKAIGLYFSARSPRNSAIEICAELPVRS